MKITGIYTLIFLLLLAGCTESTTVGGEILDQDQAALVAIDTLTIRTATVTEDDLVVYSPTQQFNTNLCGHFEDPTFGDVRADFYGQFRINQNALPSYPITDSTTFDSLVLLLEYDLDGIYGDSTAEHEFEIYRIMATSIDSDSAFVSGNELPLEPSPLTTIRFRPDYERKIDRNTIMSIDSVATPPDTTFGTFNPFFSIKLPTQLMNDLVDINIDNNDGTNELFLANFGGLAIRPVGGPTASMLSFNIGALRTGLRLHYSVGEGENKDRLYEYNITTASIRFSSFDNNQNPTIVAAEAAGFEGGITETYIQGMDGPNTVIQLPYITNFKDQVIVNNAELEVTIRPGADEELYPTVNQITILYRNEEGNLITIDDFLFTIGGIGLEAFGGIPETFTGANGEMLNRYRMNIGGHLQRMISGELPNEIYLRIFQKNERANRVVLYGSGHPDYPVTLNANLTNLN